MRVDDVKGMGPAAFMLTVSVAALALRILTHKLGSVGYAPSLFCIYGNGEVADYRSQLRN